MISNQVIQTSIDELKNITKVDLCVMDLDGLVVAATFESSEISSELITNFIQSPADSQIVGGYHMLKILEDGDVVYVLVARGTGADAYMIGKVAVSEIQNLVIAYKEHFDKNNFFQNLLLDNLLLVDIYSRSKKLHIQTDVKRAVLIVESPNGKDANILEKVRENFGQNGKDFVTAVDENNVIIVKEIADNETNRDIDKYARAIEECLNKEGIKDVHISYGTNVKEIKEVSRSYKEAKMALDVGKIFFAERDIIAYSELGIGRLIYQLPIPLCKMFIKEIFGGKSPDDFDEETLTTINKFFENSLNVSETSRQLFIHRNTLVYRLDKLQKSTGLDLRVFEDAITFKIALMVVRYMKYMESFEY